MSITLVTAAPVTETILQWAEGADSYETRWDSWHSLATLVNGVQVYVDHSVRTPQQAADASAAIRSRYDREGNAKRDMLNRIRFMVG